MHDLTPFSFQTTVDKLKAILELASQYLNARTKANSISMVGENNSPIKVAPTLASGDQIRPAPGANATRLVNAFPLTVIVRDRRENPKKCTILPLRGRSDLIFLSYPVNLPSLSEESVIHSSNSEIAISDWSGYVRLAPEGPELSPADAHAGLLLLDGSWRRAEAMNRSYQHIAPRSLKGYRTAYPRVSKKGTDPATGLATIEALFLAYRVLGRTTVGLLDHYRWAEEFLRLNDLL
jgi:pre-rRNA-processing protein TSR3